MTLKKKKDATVTIICRKRKSAMRKPGCMIAVGYPMSLYKVASNISIRKQSDHNIWSMKQNQLNGKSSATVQNMAACLPVWQKAFIKYKRTKGGPPSTQPTPQTPYNLHLTRF